MQKDILKSFNDMKNKETQDEHLGGLITVRDIQRHRVKSGGGIPRLHTYLYKLKEKSSLSKADETVETICFDFQQNMDLPTISSGKVFYSRQLWLYSFSIHDWYKVVKDSSKKFEVIPVSQYMLKNFSERYQSRYKELLNNARNVKFMIYTYKLFQYNMRYKQAVRCTESLNAALFFDFPIMYKYDPSSLIYQKIYSKHL
ncbi:hypothetical protein ANN_14505 [Periplaneta americana]|uniref:Uncharacterized protein n=1 Tax=Periplaneta americana TaxID=6978 RepID=A0ABQ8SXR3_PERAM|nr:hypothetical protein ANN_14505 [Periplaneta americana]